MQLVRISPIFLRRNPFPGCFAMGVSDRPGDHMIDIFRCDNRLRCSFPPDEPVRHLSRHISAVESCLIFTSRTKHCWQNYVDYYKCVNAKGEDFRPCRQVLSPSTLFTSIIISNINTSSTTPSVLCAPRPGPTAGTVSVVRLQPTPGNFCFTHTNHLKPLTEAGNFPAHLDR